MAAIVAIAVISLLASFICSLFEAALYAITPTQVEILRDQKVFGANRMARLRAHIDEPIAAILTINTMANTLGSALCGALVSEHYGNSVGLAQRELVAETAVGVFAGVFTLSVLIFSEIIPKSLGVRFAVPLAPRIAWPLQWMIWVSWPIARASRGLMRLLTTEGHGGPSAEEILILSRLARQGGTLRAQEQRWVENALKLDTVTAHDLMTPRTVVDSLPADLTVGEIRTQDRSWAHTRLPLTEGDNPDAIVGLVHGKDLFLAVLQGRDVPLRQLAQPIDFVPEGLKGHQLLDKFIVEKKHLVAVVDEYGGFEGIVTLEDVVECLLGSEIMDEHDDHADMQVVARRMAQAMVKRVADEGSAGADSGAE